MEGFKYQPPQEALPDPVLQTEPELEEAQVQPETFLEFKKLPEDEKAPGVTRYLFDEKVGVAIDPRGRNYKPLPEISFVVPNEELGSASLDQPEEPIEGVNMRYVATCIRKVAEESGIHKFWFAPYKDDAVLPTEEERAKRAAARLRLFRKIAPSIEPAPGGRGYILTV